MTHPLVLSGTYEFTWPILTMQILGSLIVVGGLGYAFVKWGIPWLISLGDAINETFNKIGTSRDAALKQIDDFENRLKNIDSIAEENLNEAVPSIASSRADWTFAGARFTSSASRTGEKIGPFRTLNCWTSGR